MSIDVPEKLAIFMDVAFMAGLILVRDVMTREVKVVREDTSMQEVIATMIKFDISSIVVVQKNRPVGLITHKDILMKVLKRGLPTAVLTARQVMSSPLITIKEEISIEEAAQLMATNKFKKLPVVRDGKLVGIVTSMDIVREHPRSIELMEDLLKPGTLKS